MRLTASMLACVALGLAACDSGQVPPPGQSRDVVPTQQLAGDEVLLRGQGLVAGVEAFYFAAGKTEVEAALERTLGDPVASGDMSECGAGPMQFSSYPGGLSVNFQDGNLVGWTLAAEDPSISVIGEVQVGSSESDARNADGFTQLPETSLGEEFTIGPRIGGLLKDGEVAMLYAGNQCFFR